MVVGQEDITKIAIVAWSSIPAEWVDQSATRQWTRILIVHENCVMEIPNIESFLQYLETIRERTLRVVRLIPEDKLEWRHMPGVFSPGDLARHIAATERYTFAENVLGRPSRYAGCGCDLAEGKAAIEAFMQHMHSETISLLRVLRPEDLQRKGSSPQGQPITSWKLLRAMVEHEIHHRGEIYVYLALLGVPRPPLYGLTEPELRAFSSPPAVVQN
jgi:uncharacterized damage-inducible protein DinB